MKGRWEAVGGVETAVNSFRGVGGWIVAVFEGVTYWFEVDESVGGCRLLIGLIGDMYVAMYDAK
eukprot:scaffold3198_cov213-Alexandrium_tamarense.AAC.11